MGKPLIVADRCKPSAPRGATPPPGLRISQFLARCGLGARRVCEDLVRAGRVTLNGAVCTNLATRVVPEHDAVCLDGRPLAAQAKLYLALHKPPGYTCSAQDAHAGHLVGELLPPGRPRLFTVGRLDRDSEGLILLTNDGDFAQRLAHPSHGVEKTYRIDVQGHVTPAGLRRMTEGIRDDGETLRVNAARAAEALPGGAVLEVRLGEGRKREIRRLCRACGWTVHRLIRLAVGPVTLGALAPGQWRSLTGAELEALGRR